ncbi:MAG: beta-lactamase family protein [Ignavibacteriaceae bacterium]|nr:beta-lactamase family protein [Ignavibacteriaceae bacterium]
MKKVILINCLLLITAISINAQQTGFPKLTGPYLGQEPPGKVPEIFAHDITSCSGSSEWSSCFSTELDEFYFYRIRKDSDRVEINNQLQAVLDESIPNSGGIGVSAAVIFADGKMWQGTCGISHEGVPITTDMLFDIASTGKTFTAALVLQLAEEGLLSLEDSLHKWLPDFANIDNTITIRQLLNHTSGIAHFTENPLYWKTVFDDMDHRWTPEEILTLVPEQCFQPGEGWHYSSTNYVLLGMIIEKATESTICTQLRNRLFIPFNLGHTRFSLDPDVAAPSVLAHAHFDLNRDGILDDIGMLPRTSIFSSVWTSGPVVTTAKDLARWADFLYGGRVLQKESYDQMIDFHRPTPGEPLMSGYGLGTVELKGEFFGEVQVWGHLGWQPGYMTAMLYFPEYSVSMVVMINDNNENSITSIGIGLWNVIKNHLNQNYKD